MSAPSGAPPGGATVAAEVPVRTLLSYSGPLFGLSSLLFFTQFYFFKYATDVLFLAPATVGVIFAAGRAWDAVSDPMVGTWSDRTRSRLGRRRPWMLAGVPALAVCFSLVWLPPTSLTGGSLVAWTAAALFAFYTAFTIYAVPHQSLGAELTSNHHERSRIFGLNHVSFTLGMMLAFGAMQFVNNAEAPRAAAGQVVALAAVMVVLVLTIPPLFVRERGEYQGRGAERPLAAIRDVLRNPHARVVLVAQFIQILGITVLGVLSPYMLEYVILRPDMIGPLPAIFVVCSIASVPLWLRFARKYGKSRAWQVSMLGMALSFGSTFLLSEGQIGWMAIQLVFAGVSAGAGGAVGPSILADVIDYDELQSNERKEGAYSAAWGFAIKAANVPIIVLTGIVLEVSGFVPNQAQPESAKLALRLLYAGIPFVMFLIGAAWLRRFRLDEREHARIRAALDARATSSAHPTAP